MDSQGTESVLYESDNDVVPLSWSPDGRVVLFAENDPVTRWDLWILPLTPGAEARPFGRTQYRESSARFSPDGRWIAYVSDESGRNEVYVEPHPGPGRPQRISADGGFTPSWRADGSELFYISGSRMIAVPVQDRASMELGMPQVLFSDENLTPYAEWGYDVTDDGQRFLMTYVIADDPGWRFILVQNWFSELKRLVPTP